jgi:hypothetical protein
MVLAGDKDREMEIWVSQERGKVTAETIIAGRPWLLEKLYIDFADRFGLPKANHIELFGRDPKTGDDRYEKIMPK